jgi:hypothetical protein
MPCGGSRIAARWDDILYIIRRHPIGCLPFCLAAAAVVVGLTAAATAAAQSVVGAIAAAGEQQDQDDDPPAVVATKEAVTVTHNHYLQIIF